MELPKRKSPRISNFDYTSSNYYFVTICTADKNCIFGKSDQLNDYGIIASEHILHISDHYEKVSIDKYVVMPNHIHMIVVLEEGNKVSLSTVIGQYKSGVSHLLRKADCSFNIWQRSYHDHIIRNQRQYEKIWLYIENNPIKWKEDCFYMSVNK